MTNGGKVWYRISGANQKGTPLIVLHGGPGATHFYLEPLEALADERPVILYDQLGCGNSERPENPSLWTTRRFAQELGQIRKILHLEEVHILGHSWGTMLAAEYMVSENSEGVMSLILSGPALSAERFTNDQRAHLQQLPREMRQSVHDAEQAGKFDSPEYQKAMDAFYHRFVCRLDPWPECLTRALEHMGESVYHEMWGPSEFTVTGNLKDFDRSGDLASLKIPILFTCGRFDEATPETTAYYHRQVPGSELVIFEDASHMHHLEKTDEYLKTIRDFLRRIENS